MSLRWRGLGLEDGGVRQAEEEKRRSGVSVSVRLDRGGRSVLRDERRLASHMLRIRPVSVHGVR